MPIIYYSHSLLEQLRINAKTVMVPWDHVVSEIGQTPGGTPNTITQFDASFIRAVNEMIKRNSGDTAVSFLNLPLPPAPATCTETDQERYLSSLRMLTDNLPPVLLVHGLSSVISTAL